MVFLTWRQEKQAWRKKLDQLEYHSNANRTHGWAQSWLTLLCVNSLYSFILEASLSVVCHHTLISSQAQAAIKQIIKMYSEHPLDVSEIQTPYQEKDKWCHGFFSCCNKGQLQSIMAAKSQGQLQSIMAAKSQGQGSGSWSHFNLQSRAQSKECMHGLSSFSLFYTAQGPSQGLWLSYVKVARDDSVIKLSFLSCRPSLGSVCDLSQLHHPGRPPSWSPTFFTISSTWCHPELCSFLEPQASSPAQDLPLGKACSYPASLQGWPAAN